MCRVVCFAAVCMLPVLASAEPLTDVKVHNDRAPDCSSLKSIVASVTRGCKTDDARAIALYNFCRYDHYHHAYPSESGGVSALKFINVYGWGLCGGQHTVMAALWDAAGYPWRYRGWSNPGHTTVEVFYGGRWHYLDTFLKFYAWMPDPNAPDGRTIASQEDLKALPSLLAEGFQMDQARKVCYHANNRFDYIGEKVHWQAPAFLVCGDGLSGVRSGVRSNRNSGSPRGWGGIRFDGPDYSTAVDMAPGYALTLSWGKEDDAFYFGNRKEPPRHTCGDKDYRNCPAIGPLLEPYREADPARSWSNGRLTFRPDFDSGEFVDSFEATENVVYRDGVLYPADTAKQASVVVKMASPYVVAKAEATVAGDDANVEVSTDGKTWKKTDPATLTGAVNGSYEYFVRISFGKPIRGIELTSVVQHNQESLPYLAPGRNKITVTAGNPAALGKNRLVLTYAYCLGYRERTPEEVFDRDAEIARAHYAVWSETPVVVQRVVERFPTTFEILVPTPKDKQPVYPRMVFMRRELLAPGQEPLPVPARPSTPAVGPSEALLTLPNPWTIGTEKPPEQPKRPTETTALPPKKVAYVSKKGEVFEHQFVKWLKDDSDAWVLLLDFDVKRLPALDRLADVKLVFYVDESHNRAPMQAAAVLLDAPFKPAAAYDFDKLGRTLGWTIVQQGNGPGDPFVPPRRYEIDLTRAARAWARGEPFHGLALRIVPNRGVDDGWTVR
ncbi:MAG: transglutaminase domain-containing protein, partial [Planctomycetes bacterium]|nr:transglutaminase domain-containing protein [Planctomycetota bacterium]